MKFCKHDWFVHAQGPKNLSDRSKEVLSVFAFLVGIATLIIVVWFFKRNGILPNIWSLAVVLGSGIFNFLVFFIPIWLYGELRAQDKTCLKCNKIVLKYQTYLDKEAVEKVKEQARLDRIRDVNERYDFLMDLKKKAKA